MPLVHSFTISSVKINESVSGLSGGSNLQTLTTTSTATLTIPVIPKFDLISWDIRFYSQPRVKVVISLKTVSPMMMSDSLSQDIFDGETKKSSEDHRILKIYRAGPQPLGIAPARRKTAVATRIKASFALSIPRTVGVVARSLCIGVATAAIRIKHKVPDSSS